MAVRESRFYLVCYDISDPRRLARLHRYLSARAVPVQYSVFILWADSVKVDALVREILEIINPREDDVRVYPLPRQIELETLGRRGLPEGLLLTGVSGAPLPLLEA
ncbi:CRISPR-associated endonuclease Cas2 [Thiohalobacter sp. IOR34]|uniref:CRISPR-associated endonuclease Cas2 n=1 Tax=Thiohalobacter sp. IOR34 TaxID=3057176 RepID=UPI0025B067CC|nr:CRISPR-associated endonuclease Cas2 [Thiohalobacter sp. IOR34]WJW76678.1 CRISPR-associated endonuclease Cas2 [Thiohalobacter sp. IOR34]